MELARTTVGTEAHDDIGVGDEDKIFVSVKKAY